MNDSAATAANGATRPAVGLARWNSDPTDYRLTGRPGDLSSVAPCRSATALTGVRPTTRRGVAEHGELYQEARRHGDGEDDERPAERSLRRAPIEVAPGEHVHRRVVAVMIAREVPAGCASSTAQGDGRASG
jgi:hypothetical protein